MKILKFYKEGVVL